jgi:hypothetical protein
MITSHHTNENRFARWGGLLHSQLDDMGLDVFQFRVYFHLLRRADRKSCCYPSIRSIASVCKISPRKVQEVLGELVDRQLIKRQSQRAKHGGPTSDLITIFGLPPGAPHAPPLVHDVHHPGAPGAYKGNPIEGNPFDIYEVNQKLAKTQRTAKLLESSTLPEEFVLSGFTPETGSRAWTLTRTYYQWHTYSQTRHAITLCFRNFALAIQKMADFALILQLYLDRLASLSPEDLENGIRNKQICPLDSPPWVLVKHLKEDHPQSANPRLASHSEVIQNRKARSAQATTTDGPVEVQADLLVFTPDLAVSLGVSHVKSDQESCCSAAAPRLGRRAGACQLHAAEQPSDR